MKVQSISGIVWESTDLDRTQAFYERLGFRLGSRDENSLTYYLNWFWVRYLKVDTVQDAGRVKDTLVYAKTDDAEALKSEFDAADFHTEWKTQHGGENTKKELLVHDPDGHVIVFFEK
jgi:catechol 2,3-dioxygenase-like lactoylglutathione lyase family enzyme